MKGRQKKENTERGLKEKNAGATISKCAVAYFSTYVYCIDVFGLS